MVTLPTPQEDTVRRLALVVCALASVAAMGLPARADAPATDGQLCDLQVTEDPTAEAGTLTGELTGGPVLLTQQDGITPETGTLVCRAQVGTSDHTGSGPSISGRGTGVLTAGPATVTIYGDDIYVCAEFVDDSDGVTYYWDGEASDWSTSSNVTCLRRIQCVAVDGCNDTGAVVCVAVDGCNDSGTGVCVAVNGCNDSYSLICVAVDGCNAFHTGGGDTGLLIDSIVCPIYAVVFPPEGDIPGIWDCPPYGNV
jgi:hypothetical protein